jgi:hypothetical protein
MELGCLLAVPDRYRDWDFSCGLDSAWQGQYDVAFSCGGSEGNEADRSLLLKLPQVQAGEGRRCQRIYNVGFWQS